MCTYDGEIYQLYEKMSKEDFALDLFNLVKERCEENKTLLEQYTRDSFAAIYLFFDYDGHATKADDNKIKRMLSFFDNETDNGKLFVSYPMVESILHFKSSEDFKDLIVKCKGQNCLNRDVCKDKDICKSEQHYKHKVSSYSIPQLLNLNKFDKKLWINIIVSHLKKMNYIVDGEYVFPIISHTQFNIFNSQLQKYVSKACPQIAVLSAFPMFMLDYAGCKSLQSLLK
jgi:hypothetical protein